MISKKYLSLTRQTTELPTKAPEMTVKKYIPAFPTIKPTRINNKALNMDKATGQNTPENVPNVLFVFLSVIDPNSMY